jgi:hypothetical protein
MLSAEEMCPHPGLMWAQVTGPDEILRHAPGPCEGCGGDLNGAPQERGRACIDAAGIFPGLEDRGARRLGAL